MTQPTLEQAMELLREAKYYLEGRDYSLYKRIYAILKAYDEQQEQPKREPIEPLPDRYTGVLFEHKSREKINTIITRLNALEGGEK